MLQTLSTLLPYHDSIRKEHQETFSVIFSRLGESKREKNLGLIFFYFLPTFISSKFSSKLDKGNNFLSSFVFFSFVFSQTIQDILPGEKKNQPKMNRVLNAKGGFERVQWVRRERRPVEFSGFSYQVGVNS